jgi:adenylate cyclase
LILNKQWKEENKPELITRIGIHEGEVIIGNIGTVERMNYTAIGDAVNVTFRVEEINKVYQTKIIITEEVYKKVSKWFVVRSLDLITLKGIAHTNKIYELIGQIDEPELAATPEMTQFAADFTQAFNIYYEKKWQEALSLFQALLAKFPSDYPTAMYIERCKANIQNPPGSDWTGITHYTSK